MSQRFTRASERRRGKVAVVRDRGSRRDAETPSEEQAETFNFPAHGFTCFHCGDTFHSVKGAREHFGETPDEQPGCVLKLSHGERGLLAVIRAQYFELQRYREEDQPIIREIYALGAKHGRELIAAEQRSYDKGLADGRAEAAGWPDAPLPEQITEYHAKAGDEAAVVAIAEAVVEPVSRAAAGRSAAATSEPMDATAGETAPVSRQPMPMAERIDLAAASSVMERSAARVEAARQAQAAAAVPRGMVVCKCGSRSGGPGAGQVPAWFGKDCIEAQFPLRKAA